jgi:hypothetical protein
MTTPPGITVTRDLMFGLRNRSGVEQVERVSGASVDAERSADGVRAPWSVGEVPSKSMVAWVPS